MLNRLLSITVGMVLGVLIGTGATVAGYSEAHASNASCARSHHPRPVHCRGWTIYPRLLVGPRGIVKRSGLPHCREEDGSGQSGRCSWNFRDGTTDGNGVGLSYWVDRLDGIHYVWTTSPMTKGWHWSTRGEQNHGASRYCIVRNGGTDGTDTRCPNGPMPWTR